jgi:hypothetical protein
MNANRYTPTPEQQEANDQAVREAVALIYRPLTWQQQRQADRAAGVVRRLEHLKRNRKQGIR